MSPARNARSSAGLVVEPLGGDAVGTLQQFLNRAWRSGTGSDAIRRQRQMLKLPLTEYASCVVFLLQDLDTQHVHRHHDFSIAQLLRPDVAYGIAGKVNGADNFCPVIGSVRFGRTPTTRGLTLFLFLKAREGCCNGSRSLPRPRAFFVTLFPVIGCYGRSAGGLQCAFVGRIARPWSRGQFLW